jgi:hypothetical protein
MTEYGMTVTGEKQRSHRKRPTDSSVFLVVTEDEKKNTDVLSDASKEVGLEVNQEKTTYTLISRSQKMRQKHSMKIANRSFECGKVQISGNNTNRSKLHARRY